MSTHLTTRLRWALWLLVLAVLAGTTTALPRMDDEEWARFRQLWEREYRYINSTTAKIEKLFELREKCHPECVGLLVEAIRDADRAEVQAAGLDVLPTLDEPSCVEALLDAVEPDRRNPGFADALAIALGRIAANESAECRDQAFEGLVAMTEDRDESRQIAGLKGITRSERPEAVEVLTSILEDAGRGDTEIKMLCVNMLRYIGRLDTRRCVPVMLDIASERRCPPDLVAAIIETLRHILRRDAGSSIDAWRELWATLSGQPGNPGGPEAHRTGTFRPPTEFFGTPVDIARLVFVIDTSGSMDEDLDETTRDRLVQMDASAGTEDSVHRRQLPWDAIDSKMDLAKEELIRAIEELPDTYYIGLVTYATRVTAHNPYHLVEANERNRTEIIRIIRGLRADGLTNIYNGLVEAMKYSVEGVNPGDYVATQREVSNDGVDAIYFLTDGCPTWSDDCTPLRPGSRQDEQLQPNPHYERFGTIRTGDGEHVIDDYIIRDIALLNATRPHPVTIHCIGIGAHYTPLLEALSRSTGGTYINLGPNSGWRPRR